MDINNKWKEKFIEFATNDGRHRYIYKEVATLMIEWFEKNVLAALQPSTLPLKNDSDCKSIWHNHHVRMSHFCTLCGGATLIGKEEPSTLPLIEELNLNMDARISLHLEKEPVNFFLHNILRYLSQENMKILSDNLIARLPKSVPLIHKGEQRAIKKLIKNTRKRKMSAIVGLSIMIF